MSRDAIFVPFVGMLVLTFVVWVLLYMRRIAYMKRERIHPQRVTTPEKYKALVPEEINYPANNLANLFELPVVFYALCLYLYVADKVDPVYVAAAWLFFVFRMAHSFVHCTFNRVYLRFYLYATAGVALWFMLGRVVLDLVLGAA
jgi:hypothetical protein